jgi:Polyketide cyclase / dehydrase and lipid transport
MAVARASIRVPGPTSAAEALWYDPRRWPSWVDGFGHLAKVEGDWPHAGSSVVWDSRPGGRGRVVETVRRHEPRAGQLLGVEDERLTGTQSVRFAASAEAVEVAVELDYKLKPGVTLKALTDLLFIRRSIRDSLRRTLRRFAYELAADRELYR